MKLTEMRDKYRELIEQAEAIRMKANASEPTVEDANKVDDLLKQADGVRSQIEREEKLEEHKVWAGQSQNPVEKPNPEARKVTPPSDDLGLALQGIALRGGYPNFTQDQRSRIEKRAPSGMNVAIGSEGGFLLQPEYVAGILQKTYDTSLAARLCRRWQIGANSSSLILTTINDSSRVDGSQFGGAAAYWAPEATAVTASKPALGQLEIKPKKVFAFWWATDELVQDATALSSLAYDIFGQVLSFKVDNAIINGTGAGQPLGILNAPCLVTQAKETSGQNPGSASILYPNIVKMWSRMWPRSHANAVWFANVDTFPWLASMGLTVGTGGAPAFMPANGITGTPYSTLMGRPIIFHESCSTCGTVGDIILADMSQYALVDKGGAQMAESIHVHFTQDENCYRMIYRVDGQPLWSSFMTPATGSANTLSPFVALATR
jgi:HK97 family phage major capsid protein